MKQLFLAACTHDFGKPVSYDTCRTVFMEMLPVLLQYHSMFLLKECISDAMSLIRRKLLDFKLLPCFEYCILCLDDFPASEFYVLSGCKV